MTVDHTALPDTMRALRFRRFGTPADVLTTEYVPLKGPRTQEWPLSQAKDVFEAVNAGSYGIKHILSPRELIDMRNPRGHKPKRSST